MFPPLTSILKCAPINRLFRSVCFSSNYKFRPNLSFITRKCICLQVLDGKLGDSKKQSPTQPTELKNGFLLRRSASSDSANHRTKHSHHRKEENRLPVYSKDYEEIDQIYDYVRGFAPLPKSIKSPFSDPSPSLTSHSSTPSHPDLSRPEPPPIETIPTKKLQAEKRNRKSASSTIREKETPVKVHQVHQKTPPGLPKLYVKNGHSQRSRLLRQKSASPMKETPPSPISKNGSPLFNIRYKSLNNLQVSLMIVIKM